MNICGDCAWCTNGMYCRLHHKEVGYFWLRDCFSKKQPFAPEDPKEREQIIEAIKQEIMEANPQTKTCKECGRELPLDKFRPNHKSPDGHLNTCRDCMGKKMQGKKEEEHLKKIFGDAAMQEATQPSEAGEKAVELAVERASKTISGALDQELVNELRARGWDVRCTRVIEL